MDAEELNFCDGDVITASTFQTVISKTNSLENPLSPPVVLIENSSDTNISTNIEAREVGTLMDNNLLKDLPIATSPANTVMENATAAKSTLVNSAVNVDNPPVLKSKEESKAKCKQQLEAHAKLVHTSEDVTASLMRAKEHGSGDLRTGRFHCVKPEKRRFCRTKRNGLLETTKDRLLTWIDLYSSEDYGIWIECTNSECGKWRWVKEYQEAFQVPNMWVCSMNQDKDRNSCDILEDNYNNIEFTDAEYIPGSIVWAQLPGYPWWPAMVEDDPDTEEFYWLNPHTERIVDFHVTFLDRNVTRAWVPVSKIRSFVRKEKLPKMPKSPLLLNLLEAAQNRAVVALGLTLEERLRRYSFAYCYQGKWPYVNSDKDEMDVLETTLNETQTLLKEVEDLDSLHSFEMDSSVDTRKKPGSPLTWNLNDTIGSYSSFRQSLEVCDSTANMYTSTQISHHEQTGPPKKKKKLIDKVKTSKASADAKKKNFNNPEDTNKFDRATSKRPKTSLYKKVDNDEARCKVIHEPASTPSNIVEKAKKCKAFPAEEFDELAMNEKIKANLPIDSSRAMQDKYYSTEAEHVNRASIINVSAMDCKESSAEEHRSYHIGGGTVLTQSNKEMYLNLSSKFNKKESEDICYSKEERVDVDIVVIQVNCTNDEAVAEEGKIAPQNVEEKSVAIAMSINSGDLEGTHDNLVMSSSNKMIGCSQLDGNTSVAGFLGNANKKLSKKPILKKDNVVGEGKVKKLQVAIKNKMKHGEKKKNMPFVTSYNKSASPQNLPAKAVITNSKPKESTTVMSNIEDSELRKMVTNLDSIKKKPIIKKPKTLDVEKKEVSKDSAIPLMPGKEEQNTIAINRGGNEGSEGRLFALSGSIIPLPRKVDQSVLTNEQVPLERSEDKLVAKLIPKIKSFKPPVMKAADNAFGGGQNFYDDDVNKTCVGDMRSSTLPNKNVYADGPAGADDVYIIKAVNSVFGDDDDDSNPFEMGEE